MIKIVKAQTIKIHH